MATLNKDGTLRNGGRVRADYLDEVEAAWIPALDNLGPQALRDHLVSLGVRSPVASAIVMFVADHRDLRADHLDRSTRSNYRRQLELLEPPRPRGKVRSIPGYREPAAA